MKLFSLSKANRTDQVLSSFSQENVDFLFKKKKKIPKTKAKAQICRFHIFLISKAQHHVQRKQTCLPQNNSVKIPHFNQNQIRCAIFVVVPAEGDPD